MAVGSVKILAKVFCQCGFPLGGRAADQDVGAEHPAERECDFVPVTDGILANHGVPV